MVTKDQRRQAVKVLREVLDLIEAGELTASTPQAIAAVRRLEGAVSALEAVDRT